jgi:hypothetical protein
MSRIFFEYANDFLGSSADTLAKQQCPSVNHAVAAKEKRSGIGKILWLIDSRPLFPGSVLLVPARGVYQARGSV